MKRIIAEDKRLCIIAGIFGALSAFALSSGCVIRYFDGDPSMHNCIWLTALLFLILWMVLVPVWCLILRLPEVFPTSCSKDCESRNCKWLFFLYWGILLLAYLPAFLAYYPGIFSYDASYQILQVIGHAYKTNHPLLHTLFMGVCYELGGKAGSYAAGMAVCTLLQLIILSFAYAAALYQMYQMRVQKVVLVIAFCWYALFPVNPILGISATKDTLFTAFFLLFIIQLYHYLDGKNDTVMRYVLFIITGILMLMLRNNATYALLFAAPLLWLWSKGKRVKTLFAIGLMFVIMSIGNKVLIHVTEASEGNFTEMISVPLQQLARVDYYYGETMPVELNEELHYFIPKEITSQYLPSISDPIKGQIDAARIRYEIPRFMKLWGKLLLHYPLDYVDSFLINTMGIWHIGDSSHAYVYGPGGYLLTNHQSILEGYEIEKKVLFSPAHTLYEAMFARNGYRSVWPLEPLFAPATYVWIMMFGLAYGWYSRRKGLLGIAFLMLAYCLTLFLGPTVLTRYLFCIMVCFPYLLGIFSVEKKQTMHCDKRVKHDTTDTKES